MQTQIIVYRTQYFEMVDGQVTRKAPIQNGPPSWEPASLDEFPQDYPYFLVLTPYIAGIFFQWSKQ